ncbi:NAD(P)H-hydrate epimerase [Rhodohalobacter sp.]|uniref:NAD(P)H-hydrate epimerase n=1 Tax=Rhodohalobacter sp. TaxID=1974210 RepID=UPI003561A0E3
MSINPNIPKSHQLFTADQSRSIDQKTIEEYGIDGFTLMEFAAKGAAGTIQKVAGRNRRGLFICGKGNNAGDALGAARYLVDNSNHIASIYFVFGSDNLSPDTQKNLALLQKLKQEELPITFIDELTEENLNSCDYITDGIFGTGLDSDVRSPIDDIIQKINEAGKKVISMDVPSGLNSNTGKIQGLAVKANHTCTFGTQKIGLFLNNSPQISGDISFIDLPFPSYLRKDFVIRFDDKLQSGLPEVTRTARHKYESGVVHLVAGSKGLTGAAIMAAKSAWKQGAGSVILYAPENLLPIYESSLPNIIKVVLPKSDSYNTDHTEIILNKMSEKPGVLLIGPGIGLTNDTQKLTLNLLKDYSGPAVIDADALSVWDQLKEFPTNQRMNWLLTPHPGEARNYLKLSFNDDYERFIQSRDFSRKYQLSLLMKGNPAYYHSQERSFISGYDTTPFSRAGFGDVLAGTIATKWGITESIRWAPILALLSGYNTFKKSNSSPFGPEHLLC